MFDNAGCVYITPKSFKLYAALLQYSGKTLATISTNLDWDLSSEWFINNKFLGTLDIDGGYIITLNANTLICHAWITGGIANGAKCYYHK